MLTVLVWCLVLLLVLLTCAVLVAGLVVVRGCLVSDAVFAVDLANADAHSLRGGNDVANNRLYVSHC
jgi:hypothetical protein